MTPSITRKDQNMCFCILEGVYIDPGGAVERGDCPGTFAGTK